MSNVESLENNKGIIENVMVLDLTRMQSEKEFQSISKISNVVCIIVPDSLSSSLARIHLENIAEIITVPDQANIKIISGSNYTMSGDELINSQGDPDKDMLIVACGSLFIDSPVSQIGYKEIITVCGDLIAPKESKSLLNPYITSKLSNSIFFEDSTPRLFSGKTSISKEFLELVEHPINLLVTGILQFDEDIPMQLVKEKVNQIYLTGRIIAPKELLPILNFLSIQNYGEIIENEHKKQS